MDFPILRPRVSKRTRGLVPELRQDTEWDA